MAGTGGDSTGFTGTGPTGHRWPVSSNCLRACFVNLVVDARRLVQHFGQPSGFRVSRGDVALQCVGGRNDLSSGRLHEGERAW